MTAGKRLLLHIRCGRLAGWARESSFFYKPEPAREGGSRQKPLQIAPCSFLPHTASGRGVHQQTVEVGQTLNLLLGGLCGKVPAASAECSQCTAHGNRGNRGDNCSRRHDFSLLADPGHEAFRISPPSSAADVDSVYRQLVAARERRKAGDGGSTDSG